MNVFILIAVHLNYLGSAILTVGVNVGEKKIVPQVNTLTGKLVNAHVMKFAAQVALQLIL